MGEYNKMYNFTIIGLLTFQCERKSEKSFYEELIGKDNGNNNVLSKNNCVFCNKAKSG